MHLRTLGSTEYLDPELNCQGAGGALLEEKSHINFNAEQLLGPAPGRNVRIMVTMPTPAADDYNLIRDLLAGGMDCMRIKVDELLFIDDGKF